MNREEAIEIIKRKVDREGHIYTLSESTLDIRFYITKMPHQLYGLQIITKNYSRNIHDSIILHMLGSFENIFDGIFRICRDYKNFYSKLNDSFYLTEGEAIKMNLYKIAESFMTNKKIDDCCVCFEPNSVLTICGHNLCRICAFQIGKPLQCPICRKNLDCTCVNCYNQDQDINDYEQEIELDIDIEN